LVVSSVIFFGIFLGSPKLVSDIQEEVRGKIRPFWFSIVPSSLAEGRAKTRTPGNEMPGRGGDGHRGLGF
jgi:hypothetical protein